MKLCRCRLRLALALLWPLVAQAEPIDIPQLGVNIADPPPGTTAPQVVDTLVSYAARFHAGPVQVWIARRLEPVPASARVDDPAYRKALQESLGNHPPTQREQPTSIAGLEAWAMCGAEAPPDRSVNWRCQYYVISERHLYFLSLFAISPQKPPEFDAMAQAFHGITFEPVRAATGADGQPVRLPREPGIRLGRTSLDYYPERARARGEEGVVDAEFSIDAKGGAQDVRVTYATSPDLAVRVPDLVKSLSFRVPAGWGADGSAAERFGIEVQFALAAPGSPCVFPDTTRVGGLPVTVCSSRLARP